ncbi:hypothetical protein PoB_000767700 [Plakobranchus ocellatus]|uniref:Uncharacterized protein n=1 Tax=Plakobranchus ocellatus TaxID=259542 RepID=A0AAV3YG32_9GAST|nr:hypothetical protein PoB_000767700 [Plakobranchus ocellatus]
MKHRSIAVITAHVTSSKGRTTASPVLTTPSTVFFIPSAVPSTPNTAEVDAKHCGSCRDTKHETLDTKHSSRGTKPSILNIKQCTIDTSTLRATVTPCTGHTIRKHISHFTRHIFRNTKHHILQARHSTRYTKDNTSNINHSALNRR